MINWSSIIPEPLKQEIAGQLVEFLATQAGNLAGDELAGKIRKMSSQASFRDSVDKAITKGYERFILEYLPVDEDLVTVFKGDQSFWQSKSIRRELMQLIQRPGAWMSEGRERIENHFDDVLPSRINRERVDRAVNFLLRCVTEELFSLPGAKEVHAIYSLQFQKVAAESAHEQVILARKQLETTTQLSAELKQALSQLTAVMELNLLNASAGQTTALSRPFHNLPQPDYSQFIGREEERTWLRDRLSPDDRAWLIAITGIGGVGKSALALTIAHEFRERYESLSSEKRFDAIVWISAKEEVLTLEGKEQAVVPGQVLRTLEDMYTAIAYVLNREDITRALPEEQGALVAKALQSQRTLLVMDNLESVRDERIKPFLRTLLAPTKAVITSREWVNVADFLELTGLSAEEADQLISAEARLRKLDLKVNQRERIFQLTSGLPLPIRLAIARLAGNETFDAVSYWLGNVQGDLPEYCVAGQAELAKQRDENSWKILLLSPLFDRSSGASRESLGEAVGLSLADRDRALAQLQRLFLINRSDSDRFWALPIVQRYASRFLLSSEYSDLINRWVDWMIAFVEQKTFRVQIVTEWLDYIQDEFANVFLAIRYCRDHGLKQQVIRLAMGIWQYTHIVGLHQETEEILQAARDAISPGTDQDIVADILLQSGRLASSLNQYSVSEEYLLAAEEIAIKIDNEIILDGVWATHSYDLYRQKRYDEAEIVALKAFTRGKSNPYLRNVGAYRLSAIETDRGNFDKAREWLDIAEQAAAEIGGGRRMRGIYHRRGIFSLRTGAFEAAESYLLKSLELDRQWRELRYIASDLYYLAQIYAKTNRVDLAIQTAEQAVDLYLRLNMQRDREAANTLLMELLRS